MVAAAMCWDALIVTGAGTQEVAEFIMLSAKALRRVLIVIDASDPPRDADG